MKQIRIVHLGHGYAAYVNGGFRVPGNYRLKQQALIAAHTFLEKNPNPVKQDSPQPTPEPIPVEIPVIAPVAEQTLLEIGKHLAIAADPVLQATVKRKSKNDKSPAKNIKPKG